MTMTEQLKLMAIEQSARQIQSSIDELEGVMNACLANQGQFSQQGARLQQIHKQIDQELKNINYIVKQGKVPVAQDQIAIGQKVQEAVNEISQL